MINPSLSVDAWVHDRSLDRRNRVIEEHAYLCARAARKFVRRGVDRSDLEQVAAVGLIKAVDRYDPANPAPFEAYAWVLILGELMHYVRDCERLVRAPRRLRELDRRFDVAERELVAELGRHPSMAEIAQRLGSDETEALEIRRYRETAACVSVDVLHPVELRGFAYTIDERFDGLVVDQLVSTLSPLEQKILRAIYEHDVPISVLAHRLGYSRRHVSRLHVNALKKLTAVAHQGQS
jgi:RNA polymerase sigma-B factor